jgi:hypothetical protein
MPIMPPSMPWIAAPTTPAAPLDHVGVVTHTLGYIHGITDPNTLAALAEYRNRIIEQSDGEMGVTIVERAVGCLLRPNMPTSAILDALEAVAAAGRRA